MLLDRRSAVMLMFVSLVSCDLTGPSSRDEVGRTISPNGRVEAVLIETNGGATTSFGYEVQIVSTGSKTQSSRKVAFLYGATRNTQAYGANLRWIAPDTLEINYLAAKKVDLYRSTMEVNGEQLNVMLRAGVIDLSAPAGGMLYNLEKKRTH